ncbi:MAG TPA: GxxExxY protein [Flavobacterium sp.]|jgi:GxxExxY protein
MPQIIYKSESFALVGILFDVHSHLGKGFSEIVYKDAVEYELTRLQIPFEREKKYEVHYKDVVLKHNFFADFVIYDKIILEVKACDELAENHLAQCINYLKVSGNKLALLANFNKYSLEYKRIIL